MCHLCNLDMAEKAKIIKEGNDLGKSTSKLPADEAADFCYHAAQLLYPNDDDRIGLICSMASLCYNNPLPDEYVLTNKETVDFIWSKILTKLALIELSCIIHDKLNGSEH